MSTTKRTTSGPIGPDETVKLDISIEISTRDVADTGLTVAAWNKLTDARRMAIVQEIWDGMASRDDGGITVVTPGATEV
jgi:hypothetical protein